LKNVEVNSLKCTLYCGGGGGGYFEDI